MAAGLPEATEGILRELARSVALHRRAGGALDALPARQQELLRAMDEGQRRFFLEELAKADTEEGRSRFRAARRTLAAYEAMAMVRKGQVRGIGARDMRAQASFVAELFRSAA